MQLLQTTRSLMGSSERVNSKQNHLGVTVKPERVIFTVLQVSSSSKIHFLIYRADCTLVWRSSTPVKMPIESPLLCLVSCLPSTKKKKKLHIKKNHKKQRQITYKWLINKYQWEKYTVESSSCSVSQIYMIDKITADS